MLDLMIDTKPGAAAPPTPRLWTPQGFREDSWHRAESADALAGNERVILPLAIVLAMEPGARHAARERLGVLVAPGDRIESVVGILDDLSLVALAFPAFNDGRSFSKAELLRGRHGFTGVIRATGQVLIDQLPHMIRLGFDEFEVSHPVLLKRLEAGQSGGLPLFYQPTVKPAEAGPKYSWRRRSET